MVTTTYTEERNCNHGLLSLRRQGQSIQTTNTNTRRRCRSYQTEHHCGTLVASSSVGTSGSSVTLKTPQPSPTKPCCAATQESFSSSNHSSSPTSIIIPMSSSLLYKGTMPCCDYTTATLDTAVASRSTDNIYSTSNVVVASEDYLLSIVRSFDSNNDDPVINSSSTLSWRPQHPSKITPTTSRSCYIFYDTDDDDDDFSETESDDIMASSHCDFYHNYRQQHVENDTLTSIISEIMKNKINGTNNKDAGDDDTMDLTIVTTESSFASSSSSSDPHENEPSLEPLSKRTVPIEAASTIMSNNTTTSSDYIARAAGDSSCIQSTISLLVRDFESPSIVISSETLIMVDQRRSVYHHAISEFYHNDDDRTSLWYQRKLWIRNPIVSMFVQHF